ncbi:MAG: UDP-N-acetylmuramoyl-tripeptide--D-alanyl-D-alanine ligase [Clostridia bacterium]|nr:UDP-N-acetylmuramoyl-tripeptide--D-alanyl-D-alanine ligase [Clostridia bacterium]
MIQLAGALLCAIACVLGARTLIHWFQLESYQFPGYFRTLKRQGIRGWIPGFLLGALWGAVTVMTGLASGSEPFRQIVGGLAMVGLGLLMDRRARKQKAKKELVFTPRVKRLYGVSLVILTLAGLGLAALGRRIGGPWGETLGAGMIPLLLPLWVALCGLIAWPIEKAISEMYFRDAQRILRERTDLIRIGITGSWGKTSVKFILGAMLNERYPTMVTPASFNTPMGVTKVIRTRLEPGHRIFVAEMGARHVGDIREMCRLVHPQMGLLTSVGPQHLDTFHTQERITKTKYELMDAVPDDGVCFFADDGGIVTGLWEKTEKEKILAGMDPQRDDVWAENLKSGPEGSRFTLCFRGGERVDCETELLGELNIRNIVLCAAVCRRLGLTGKEMARGIRKLKPVEHRLELKRNPGGLTVLDDAFNSNIRGAEQAFRVLKEFPGKRIVVTPGMVELGDREAEMNRAFGEAMADCCDTAILVGKKRSEAIREGLKAGGFPETEIRVAGSLNEAADLLRTLAGSGDTILFENDLPDHYDEGSI